MEQEKLKELISATKQSALIGIGIALTFLISFYGFTLNLKIWLAYIVFGSVVGMLIGLANSSLKLVVTNKLPDSKVYIILKLLKKALNIDKHNYTALNSLRTYYFNAPKIGGSRQFRSYSKPLKANNKFDNFISYVWLSKVYKEEQQPSKALNYIKQALEIYPDSPWAKEILNTIKQR